MKIIKKIIQAIIGLIYASVAIGAILVFVYFLGHGLLEGYYHGNDNSWATMMADWVNRWWPNVPWWHPLQGAGQSVMLGYLSFVYNFVVALHRFSSLTLIQSLRLIQVLSIPIIALEIYFYTWWLTKKQTPAFLAAILYPLSPIAWFWIHDIGIYAMSVSIVFFLPALWATQAFRNEVIRGRINTLKARLLLLAAAIAIALALVSHTSVGMAFLVTILIETSFNILLVKYQDLNRKTIIFRSVFGVGVTLVAGLAMSSFLFYPVMHYFGFALSEFSQTWSSEAVPTIDLISFFGLSGFLGRKWILNSGGDFLVPIVSIWAVIGTLIYLIKRKSPGTLGLTLFLLALYISIDRLVNSLGGIFAQVVLTTNIRLYGALFIGFPIVAACGIWGLADLPASLIRFIGKKFKPFKYLGIGFTLVSITLAFVLGFGSIYLFRNSLESTKPIEDEQDKSQLGPQTARFYYGPTGLKIAWCAIPYWESERTESCPDPLPPFQISKEGRDYLIDGTIESYNQRFGWDQFTRIDITPNMGQLICLASIHTDASMVVSYGAQAVVNPIFRGYQGNIYYTPDLEKFQEEQVDQLARWFGISYVWLTKGESIGLSSLYPETKWEDVVTDAPEGGQGVIKKFYQPTDYATVSTEPRVLLIGDNKKDAYEQLFRFSAKGALPYQDALLVKGPLKVDQLSVEEMKKYQVLVLHGARYGNRTRAWQLLANYVKGGGSVFIDSGWQYVAADWGITKLADGETFVTDYPDPSPIKKTTWGNIGTSWTGTSLEFDNLDLSKFAPPTWEDKPWSMAIAERTDLAQGAKPILSKGNKVIIAQKDYGQGKIIWSGINLIAYGYDKENVEEMKFFRALIKSLTSKTQGEDLKGVIAVERTNPDKVTFNFLKNQDSGVLIWREFWTPDWKGQIILSGKKSSLPIQVGGPGLMLINLPKMQAGDQIILTYHPPILTGRIITLITFILLVLSIIEMAFWQGKISKKLMGSAAEYLKHRPRRVRERWRETEEEEY